MHHVAIQVYMTLQKLAGRNMINDLATVPLRRYINGSLWTTIDNWRTKAGEGVNILWVRNV